MSHPFHGPAVYGLALDTTGERLAGCGRGFAWITLTADPSDVTSIPGARGHAYDVDFAPDGDSVVVCFHGGHVRRYALDGRETHKYVGHSGVPDGVRKVRFSADGTRIASVGEDRTLRIWDAQSTDELDRFSFRADVNTVCWGPGPRQITTGSDTDLRIIDLDTRKARVLDTEPIAEVQIVDGRIYAGWGDKIRVLDPALELLDTFAQSDVARIRVHGELLFAASWSGPMAGVSRWHLLSGERTPLEIAPTVQRHPFWALAHDPRRAVLYAGANPVDGRSVFTWSTQPASP